MKKLLFLCICIFSFIDIVVCQEVNELHENGRKAMRQANYENATELFLKALEQSPSDAAIIKDLALNYHLQKDNTRALETIKPLIDRLEDDQSFQIAGIIYKALKQHKEAEAMYKKGIKKFNKSGALYNDYGELLSSAQNSSAINIWEKGIEMDPSHSANYFNAARHYYFTTDRIWSIIYSEIFINIDPLSTRITEIKSILLDSYKKIFADDFVKTAASKNQFEQAFIQSINKAYAGADKTINAESLIMIRTRFILEWFDKYAGKFPFKLFELHRQLLREGTFPAYNQWIFGATENLLSYQNWVSANSAEYALFTTSQKARMFKIPSGQYYHK